MPTSARTELQGRMHSEESQGPGHVDLPVWNPGQQPGQSPFCLCGAGRRARTTLGSQGIFYCPIGKWQSKTAQEPGSHLRNDLEVGRGHVAKRTEPDCCKDGHLPR